MGSGCDAASSAATSDTRRDNCGAGWRIASREVGSKSEIGGDRDLYYSVQTHRSSHTFGRGPQRGFPPSKLLGMRLLAHVTFHDSNATKVAGKTTASWRDFAFGAVTRMLDEMEAEYHPFRRVHVVVDVNEENGYRARLERWSPTAGAAGTGGAPRVSVRVDAHAASSMRHPFYLAWMHRAHMASQLERYEWFLSLEADTLVPGAAMRAQIALAPPLYERHKLLLGFARVSNNSAGSSFFSDITKPAPRSSLRRLEGLGEFVTPQNTYAAVWAYPREVMRGFVASADWSGDNRPVKNMRERAAWGWRSGSIVTRVGDSSLFVYHLGKSGRFYRVERGHNILPVSRLVAADTSKVR